MLVMPRLSSPTSSCSSSHFIEMLAPCHNAPALALPLLLKFVSQAVHFLMQGLELLLLLSWMRERKKGRRGRGKEE